MILAQSFHDILDIGPGANSKGRQSDHGVYGSSLPGAEWRFRQTNFQTPYGSDRHRFGWFVTIGLLLFDYTDVLTLKRYFANTETLCG